MTTDLPERVHSQNVHEILRRHIRKQGVRSRDARIGENDIQPCVPLQGVVDDGLDGGFIGGVELSRVDLTSRVQRLDLLLVVAEEFVVKVADVDGLCAVLGVLVRGGSSNAQGRVCAYID